MMPSRPYILRALYEWLIDNQLTPHIMVDVTIPDVEVPKRFIENDMIILNIEPKAVGNLRMGNDAIEFDARFSGVVHHVFIPIFSVKAIYAIENNYGMIFNDEEVNGESGGRNLLPTTDDIPTKTGRPALKIVR
ncbi:ClpXP protease specificity-enhancing factor [Coxiella endosymbiont of Amblyomma nuttalli]|uniref:ClpXP protease specificity-enhancing factor n=1 Tax=Coxiella endosymbiont of Amblyomma nuttalli TaxID=2749996 RepID=UPI001BAA328E|nr:ClpXP protease specificity-enhancing factor [Coxiella endosymbiont of Amblyomma nuttalli]QTS84170.1 Stringent starvation protein B [Coxiella endosymbiont of Amblyomma nuttalli]